ncbi:DUF998 domain-containing protein [Streptomyces fradiae]
MGAPAASERDSGAGRRHAGEGERDAAAGEREARAGGPGPVSREPDPAARVPGPAAQRPPAKGEREAAASRRPAVDGRAPMARERDLSEERDVSEERHVSEERDVSAERDVSEERDLSEERPVPEERDPAGPGGGRFVAVLLALGALTYSVWLLEGPLATGLDPVQSYVSELAATDQPFGALFRATDLLAGLLLLAAALPRLLAARRRFWAAGGWAALALFGAATAADSRLPLSCAPTVDALCAAREDAGLVPFGHTAHAVSSGLATTGAVTAVVALTVAARRYGWWPPLARTGPLLVVLELAATAWTLVGVAAFEAERGHWGLGAGQRAQLLLLAVWLLVLAWSLWRGPGRGDGGGGRWLRAGRRRAEAPAGPGGRSSGGSSGGRSGGSPGGPAGGRSGRGR